MFASPLLFDRVGWGGVANATPNFMLWAGLPFFAGCIAYTFMAGESWGPGLGMPRSALAEASLSLRGAAPATCPACLPHAALGSRRRAYPKARPGNASPSLAASILD